MISLVRKGNTSTGVHMLQKYNGKFRIKCSRETLKRATSVEVKPEYRYFFTGKDEIYHSELFENIETGKKALIDFISKTCGVSCTT